MLMRKEYKPGTYVVKKVKNTKTGSICPICKSCNNKKLCNNRKDPKLMRKCPECQECSDKDNCDTFYINIEHKIQIPVGIDADTGATIRKSFNGKTESEALYKAVQYQKDMERGDIKPVIKRTLHSIYSICTEYEETKLRNGITNENTYNTNISTINRLKKNEWCIKPILDVTREQIENYLLSDRANGLSNSVIKKDYAMLRNAFDIALEKNYIPHSHHYFLGRYGIIQPKSLKKNKKVRAFNISEQIQLIKFLQNNNIKHKDLFTLCLNTGARIGELLALSVEDVHLDENYFYINKTTTLNKAHQVVLGPATKTPAGERIVVLNEITKPVLEHAIQVRNVSNDNLIFCKEDGSLYGDSGINSAFKRFCKSANINGEVHTHMCRHTFVTRAKEAGMEVEATKSLVGHQDDSVLKNTYNDNQLDYLQRENEKYVKYILNLNNT